MEYTKNLGNKLLNAKFKLKYNHKDNEIEYDVFIKEMVEVTIDHTNKKVTFHIVDSCEVEIRSMGHLLNITSLLNK